VSIESMHIIIEIVMAIVLAYVGAKARKIDGLERRLEIKSQDLIDARFKLLETEIKGWFNAFNTQLGHINSRLRDGDEHFDTDADRLQKQEIQTERLKAWMLEKFATREDQQNIGETISTILQKQAHMEAMVNTLKRDGVCKHG